MSRTGAFIVTGAGSGIGQAITLKIIQNGHQVFGLGRDPKKLEVTARLAGAGTNSFRFASVDLSNSNESSRMSAEIKRWLQDSGLPLLGVVNNAGVFDRLSFRDTSDKVWEKQFNTNLLSAVRITREMFDPLKASAPSSVLNISSTLGLRPIADTLAYSAIKAAMINWTQGLALEWAPFKIRVNCICPGIVNTPIHSATFGKDENFEGRVMMHAAQPLKRMGTPSDIAEASWFLLSENSSWTTGSVLSVDGGIGL